MSEGAPSISQKQINKLINKAKELGYKNVKFFIEDIDVLLRPANLLKEKDMKYFELENLITLLTNKEISLGMAPRMISMVSKYAERNEELEKENADLKQSNITIRSKYQTANAQVKELKNQLSDLSSAPKADAKIREENIKLTEENKYLKMTNETLQEDLKTAKAKLDEKIEEANFLDVENSQLELRIKNLQKEIEKLEEELAAEKQKEKGKDVMKQNIEKVMLEIDELYEKTDDPFKKEFLAFLGIEFNEIFDGRKITKQKLMNQLSIHAREMEKVFEPQLASMRQQPTPARPAVSSTPEKPPQPQPTPKKVTPKEPEKPKQKPKEKPEDKESDEDRYVKPSEFLRGKSAFESAEEGEEAPVEEKEAPKKPVFTPSKSKKKKKVQDRKPTPELIEVFNVFIKYLDQIDNNKDFNDLCDKLIEELYEHVGSPGMTKVYKIKSGGVKRKKMLIDLLKQWKKELPEM
ncbi:MAG: hypothetical protein U9O98_09055 [Asgard group archaeon]|nr:hypothetical protein [Asgard group archaeon]